MIFNSIEFLVFIVLFFGVYWLLKKYLKAQNWLILIGSYLFYGWWDWRFLSLIAFSTVVDFILGSAINRTAVKKRKKLLLSISLTLNLGLLVFFKYYNFFVESFRQALENIGLGQIDSWSLNILLPVGISFYTFQTLSYTLDIYYDKIRPTSNFINFASFVSFFPQLVAGPIERASNLLPQIEEPRRFDLNKSINGVRQIVWGLFKKIVIADSLATPVNDIFGNFELYGSTTLIIGAILFSFQIYCDFSGYSDIAIGCAALLGINLMTNFRQPYFSRNIGEFWRRWHISLSTWFRDYIYIPLGGSQVGKYVGVRNVFIIFLVSGFWHGANWTFIIWGLFHAILFLPSFVFGANRKFSPENRKFILSNVPKIIWTFCLVTFGWIFFRADSLTHAYNYILGIFAGNEVSDIKYLSFLVYPLGLLILEWTMRNNLEAPFSQFHPIIRRSIFFALGILILYFFEVNDMEQFIYFQF